MVTIYHKDHGYRSKAKGTPSQRATESNPSAYAGLASESTYREQNKGKAPRQCRSRTDLQTSRNDQESQQGETLAKKTRKYCICAK